MCGKCVVRVGTPAAGASILDSMNRRASAPTSVDRLDRPVLPTELAFVVRFGGDDRESGRVEHVISGRGVRFHNREEMLAFINDTLARIEAEHACPAGPASAGPTE